ncbi:MAG: hypothetical protein FWD92_07000 [Methanomassiliicoccaceae archaeon]|nr:hypothetical protein [Methanomassiliicoccaceae archaeon]
MKETFIKRNAHVSELSLVRTGDRMILSLFLVSLLICTVTMFVIVRADMMELGAALMILSVPFLVIGLITYVQSAMWKALLIAIAIPAILFFANVPMAVLFFVAFLLVGCVGVVAVAVVLQRMVFFAVISSVEYLNIKEKLTLWDKIVMFAFNIPPNVDTRKITMEYNLKRSGIPIKEMTETMLFAFLVGISLWIYLSLNPAFMNNIRLYEAPIYVFSLVMFIPLLVLPWTPFKSLNVRISSNYRDFSLYGGAVETLRKMVVPVFMVFIFIMVAVNTMSIAVVIAFILSSVAFNMIVVAASSVIFYMFFESEFVDDAVIKWKAFRPILMEMDLEDGHETLEALPGTPVRDLSDMGDIEFISSR